MNWIGLNKFDGKPIWTAAGQGGQGVANDDQLLISGTLLIEGECEKRGNFGTTILEYSHFDGWQRALSISRDAQNRFVVEFQQGNSRARYMLDKTGLAAGDVFVFSYSWNGPERLGHIEVTNRRTGRSRKTGVTAPFPFPLSDLQRLIRGQKCKFHPNLHFLAVSNSSEKLFANASIGAGSLVQTEGGLRPVETLTVGERVLTENCGFQPVLRSTKQVFPAAGSFTPIVLRSPYYSLSQNIVVAPHQKILMSGVDLEYTFGSDGVFVEAGHLMGHHSVHVGTSRRTFAFYEIQVDVPDCIQVAGAWLLPASQTSHPGKSYRNSGADAPYATAASPLSFRPVLHSYEAVSLISALGT